MGRRRPALVKLIDDVAKSSRRAERNAQRRRREIKKKLAAKERLNELEQARLSVEEHENLIERLTSVHCEGSEPVDWTARAFPEPPPPTRVSAKEDTARNELESYKPSFFTRVFGGEKKALARLQQKVEEARAQDERDFAEAKVNYDAERAAWLDNIELTKSVLAGDPQARKAVVVESGAFDEVGELGSEAHFTFGADGSVTVEVNVHSTNIIPNQLLSLTAKGKLSQKAMPKTRFFEIYQDYVCSVTLRTAREIFALLPVDGVVVTAVDEILDSATGHEVVQPILSVAFERRAFEKLNLARIDPSDSMRNFQHNMKFQKTKGFAVVERVN